MFFSKSCIYAIRAAIYLAVNSEREFIPIKEVANELNISFHFLTKILQTLSQSGIIESVKGPKGGATLKDPANQITVYRIITAIDGEKFFESCVLNLPGCKDDNPCSLHSIWADTRKKLKSEFKNATLEKLAKEIQNGKIRLFDFMPIINHPDIN